MKKDITFENGKFIVTSYEENAEPANIALKFPQNGYTNNYSMPNGVDVRLHTPYGWHSPTRVEFLYHDFCVEKRKAGNKVSLCDMLNHYYAMSSSELEERLQSAQTSSKSQLEEELDELNNRKKTLMETVDKAIEDLNKLKENINDSIESIKN
jgi:hypothetical protein